MQEASMDMTGMAMGQQAGDEQLMVKFSLRPWPDPIKTEEAGRPIMTDTLFINIRAAGSKGSSDDRPAVERDKLRFPRHWEAFSLRQVEDYVEGTPLSEWPAMDRSTVENLKFLHIRTVEQLIDLSDTNSQGFMGIQSWKEKARKFLELSSTEAAASAVLKAEARVVEVESQIAELKAKFDSAPPAAAAQTPALGAEEIAAMIAKGVAAAVSAQPAPKAKRKRRSAEEMAAAKAEEAKTE
jgi:hypothetical protein